ncbi:DNA alkylation repair protein [Paraflavitalea pollutisoli]|uniref:DNA alkylation repair protein n=1 Tax=Paraflavitalea pollutisoli TaxID=3034143 RepID=UPI0023EDD29D|nr:DNA alkylation repair protein [Paraflavitalea sp. H1-2-19X]
MAKAAATVSRLPKSTAPSNTKAGNKSPAGKKTATKSGVPKPAAKKAATKSAIHKPAAKKAAVKSISPKSVKAASVKTAGKADLTARVFIDTLMTYQSDAELKKYERYFSFNDEKPLVGDQFVGVRMGHVFEVAKLFVDMPVKEIEKLMEHAVHEMRAGAMSIMGKAASAKKVTEERLKELYDLYLRRHDRVNSWDLVDLAAHQVVGRYLYDKPRKVLYQLAQSKNPYERRTAILSTAHFIRQGEVDETFRIAALLMKDTDETVNKATGWMLRYAGKDRKQLKTFLDKHAATMPRSALRNALEHFDSKEKAHYMGLKKG